MESEIHIIYFFFEELLDYFTLIVRLRKLLKCQNSNLYMNCLHKRLFQQLNLFCAYFTSKKRRITRN